jgi:mRNA-degrading endonuclease RelE of RelBE toxin-antitoxin system
VTENPDRDDIVVAPAAARALSERLPEAVAGAVIEFITGPLLDDPQRLGRELRGELAGLHPARRGTFRVLYRIDEKHHEAAVLRIEHRGDVYRPR